MGKPTHLARQLKALVDGGVSQVQLHSDSGISQGQISRYTSSIETPSVNKLNQLVRRLPRQDRIRLAIAHLRDETPESVKGEIRIVAASQSAGAKARAMLDLPMPKALQDALYFIAQEAAANPDVAESIMASARVLGFKASARVLYEGPPLKPQAGRRAASTRSQRRVSTPIV